MPTATRRPKSTGVKKQELFFDWERETKGTHRFKEAAEEGKRPVMGTIWITKDVCEKIGVGEGDAVKLTIEPDRA